MSSQSAVFKYIFYIFLGSGGWESLEQTALPDFILGYKLTFL